MLLGLHNPKTTVFNYENVFTTLSVFVQHRECKRTAPRRGWRTINTKAKKTSLNIFGCRSLSVFVCVQCFTCNCCGFGAVFDTILSAALCVLWLYFSASLTKDHNTINNSSPYWNTAMIEKDRTTVLYLSWAEVVLFGLTTAIGMLGLCPEGRSDKYNRDQRSWSCTLTRALVQASYSALLSSY